MASFYRESRNCELSLLKFIEDSVDADWSGVTVVKTFTALEKASNPVICVMLDNTNYTREELGSTGYMETYIFTIDIYASSDGQRVDLSDYLINKLISGWTYYTVELQSGGGRTLQYTSAGRCRIDRILSNDKINLGSFGDAKERYRQNISIAVTVGCN